MPLQVVFAADNSITISQTDLELEIGCENSNQALSVALTLPKVFALSQDKSSVIIQDNDQVVAKIYGESSIQKFTGEAKMDFLQSLTTEQAQELTVETISFRTGNSVISKLNLAAHRDELAAFSASCKA